MWKALRIEYSLLTCQLVVCSFNEGFLLKKLGIRIGLFEEPVVLFMVQFKVCHCLNFNVYIMMYL